MSLGEGVVIMLLFGLFGFLLGLPFAFLASQIGWTWFWAIPVIVAWFGATVGGILSIFG